MGGDFNCVFVPERDRYARARASTARKESPALLKLLESLQLQDALEVIQIVSESDTRSPSEHFTFWRSNQTSRTDRFYVATALCPLIQWEETAVLKRHSDHQAIILTLKDTRSRALGSPKSKRAQLRYPIASSLPDLILIKVQEAIQSLQPAPEPPDSTTRDEFLKRVVTSMKSIKSAEQRQTREYIKKIAAETSTLKSTRGDFV